MFDEKEVLDFLRQLFADGRNHSTAQITRLLKERFGMGATQAMRRVSKLCANMEVQKVRRGFYRKYIEPDEQLYKLFIAMRNAITTSGVTTIDVTDFSENYRLAVCELIYIIAKVDAVIARLESEVSVDE